MPKLDGEATARRLRERGYVGPIIALSAGRSPSPSALTRAGLTAFLSKAASIDEVLAACKEHILVAKKTTVGAPAQADRKQERTSVSRDTAARSSLARGSAGPTPGDLDTYSADPRLRILQGNYVASLTGIVEELQQAVNNDDSEALKRVAHRMIGTCGLFGFAELAEIAEKLQDAVERQPAQVLEQHVLELRRHVTGIQRRLATGADQRAKPR
jgi:HPt (histidine-containing phosphotransfer) domain-containing protein